MNFITSSYDQSSQASKTGFEQLSIEDVLVLQEGYMFIYVSNQEEQANIAYFDDIKVEHKHSPVLQSDDYYPFGLTFNSYQRSFSKANNFKYNGIENIPDLGLNVNMYMFRTYDPALGRWWQIDPLYKHFESPYATVTNNPIRFFDLFGLDTLSSRSKDFNWADVQSGDVVDGGTVLEEVSVSGTSEVRGGGIAFSARYGQSQEDRNGSASYIAELPRFMGGANIRGLLNVVSSWISIFSWVEDVFDVTDDMREKNYDDNGEDVKPQDPTVEEKVKLKAAAYKFREGHDMSFKWDGAKHYPIEENPDSLEQIKYWNKGKVVEIDTFRIK
jgi:RHS repeat-associated protein